MGVSVGFGIGPVRVSKRIGGGGSRVSGDGVPGVIGFFAVGGALLGAWLGGDAGYYAGFWWGLGIGATLYLLVGAAVSGLSWFIFALTTLGGMWLGGLIGGADGIFPGLGWGLAVFAGWLVHLLLRWFIPVLRRMRDVGRKRLTEEWPVPADEVEDARWHYLNDDDYRLDVDLLAVTDPKTASELSGGLA